MFDKESVVAFVAFACVFVAMVAHVWPFSVDDAFIVARYARRIISGDGYTFSDGPATDGITGPLWLVPALAGELIGVGAVPVQKLAGVACMLGALGLTFFSLSESKSRAFLIAFCSLQANLVIWSSAGLETGAATLLCATVFVAAVNPSTATRMAVRSALVASALLVSLRPEALPFAVVGAALTSREDGWKHTLLAAAIPLLAWLFVAGARWAAFGHPLPLSYFAKSTTIDPGYALTGLLVTTGALPVLVAAWAARSDAPLRAALLVLVIWLMSIAWAGGDWMPGFRLLVPVIPVLAWILARTFAQAGLRTRILLVICLLAPLLDSYVQLPRARAAGKLRQTRGHVLAERAKTLAQGGKIAIIDIGFVGYQSRLPILDLGGVTDPRVGRAAGGHLAKQIDIGLLETEAPSVIVLHGTRASPEQRDGWPPIGGYPIETWLYTQPWTRAHYQPPEVFEYAPGYSYCLLARK